ncbi:bifunctional riboflavin kinase/FAD synthetase [Thiotrichales bacterium 19S3-7]|nr:bifunctional riboflavin kinase/FAD synthetase [Thiotrichales bacterium 19S3-7]MCF6801726.1 bifunctional riboflavin kinase/FAD synthetase [Thiotrichales bacterium 19S3-11]
MRILRQADLKNFTESTAITIGAFDGIHKGHQFVLQSLSTIAKTHKLTPIVVCFEPQPKEYFLKDKAPKRLTTLRDRINLIEQTGITNILILKFDQTLKNLTAEAFIEKILVNGLNLKHILIGDDFRFGKNQKGDINLLKSMAKSYHYAVEQLDSFVYENKRISSSIIRDLINKGHFQQAKNYLGYPYAISGRIIHGDKNGRKLGFSTINIPLKQEMAVSGVYIVQVTINSQTYFGVANIGRRPTLNGLKRLLEVHIFKFNQVVYHKIAKIEFLHWLRNEVKFANLDELKMQIALDIQKAKSWLHDHQPDLIEENEIVKEATK